jgi:hypothetical protein
LHEERGEVSDVRDEDPDAQARDQQMLQSLAFDPKYENRAEEHEQIAIETICTDEYPQLKHGSEGEAAYNCYYEAEDLFLLEGHFI